MSAVRLAAESCGSDPSLADTQHLCALASRILRHLHELPQRERRSFTSAAMHLISPNALSHDYGWRKQAAGEAWGCLSRLPDEGFGQ